MPRPFRSIRFILTSLCLVAFPMSAHAIVAAPNPTTDGNFTISWTNQIGSTYRIYETQPGLNETPVPIFEGGEDTLSLSYGPSYGTYSYRLSIFIGIGWMDGGTTKVHILPSLDPPAAMPQPNMVESESVGSLDGQFRVDESGSATFAVRINAAPGTAGVTPALGLAYASGNSSNGPAGLGFSVTGLSAVSRCRQTLVNDGQPMPITWTSDDRLCLDGQRLLVQSGSDLENGSTYETEIASYSQITAHGATNGAPDYITVEGRDGSTSWYGKGPGDSTTQAQVRNAASDVLSWNLRTFEDSAGNRIWFDYANDVHGVRIATVKYAYGGAPGPLGHHAEIEFMYEVGTRPDPSSQWVGGHEFVGTKRLERIVSREEGN